jgi:2-phosphoglycerate kinase
VAQVLLIGGSSSSGKTTLAGALAEAHGGTVVTLDVLRDGRLEEQLQEAFTSKRRPQAIVRQLVAAGEAFAPVLAQRIADAQRQTQLTVIEGERILPATLARLAGGCRALFLVEARPEALRRNLEQRSGGFSALRPDIQDVVVEVDYRFGRMIESEAAANGFPVVSPRPWETLVERSSAVLQLTRASL